MIDMLPLISVIIPVYKVESYLDECVVSVINQTYQNIEMILVDDGSPDHCPSMCDKWAEKDSRIVVIHKPNGGLSSARNAGLDIAKGEYIGFVDSDDYITHTMYEDLFKAIQNAGSACAIANGRIISEKGGKKSVYKEKWNIKENRFISYKDFATLTLSTQVGFTVWSKLYRSDVIKRIRFREGRNNEDTLFMFELSKTLESIEKGMIDIAKNVYYYRLREDSICRTSKVPLEIDVVRNFSDILNYYHSNGDARADIIEIKRDSVLTQLITKLLSDKEWEKRYWDEWHQKLKQISTRKMIPRRVGYKMFIDFMCHKYIPSISKLYLHFKYKQ